MTEQSTEFDAYPEPSAVDTWLDGIRQTAEQVSVHAERVDDSGLGVQLGVRHTKGGGYVRFVPQGMDPFYAYWQPAPSGPAPLLVHTPGHPAEMSVHPGLVMQGYNELHVNPLGYGTPSGADASKRCSDSSPVLEDTAVSRAQRGYRDWLTHCVIAIEWAQARKEVLPDRTSVFGTSQGGGASLLLGSLYQGRRVRCVAADVPWLINFPLAKDRDVAWGQKLFDSIEAMPNPADGWYALGMIDVLSHARRLTVPVMLTAGGEDVTCLPETIESLFDRLPATRMYCYLQGQEHDYTQEFIALAGAWFRLYA